MIIKRIGKLPTKKDLQECLQDKVIPLKFCYLQKGGDVWHQIRESHD